MENFESQAKELIDYLREERPALAADLDNGKTLLSAHDGHFVAWDEIISACGGGCYGESPLELITEIIDQRDALRDEMKAIALALGRSKTDGESDCDWHAMADDVKAAVTEKDRLIFKAEAMRLVIAPLSVKADISEAKLFSLLDEAERALAAGSV